MKNMFDNLRKELYDFYLHGDVERSQAFAKRCFEIMNERVRDDMTVTEQKLLQYDVICEQFEPVIFKESPYFYETGVLTSLSDGSRNAKSHGFIQANGWVFERNRHLFREQSEELYQRRMAQGKEILYLICGDYNDDNQHFNFYCGPILEVGLSGICKRAEEQMSLVENDEEREFLNSVCHGMHALKRMADKFAVKAEEMLLCETDEKRAKNLRLIAKTATRVPWNAPETLYEALATLAFLRTAMGSLEGVGPNTFGRVDKDLISFYKRDIAGGVITAKEAYELICQFLIIWDCHYDHDMIMAGYADHELENTYTLGGCNDDGTPLYNEITEMFLRANREEKIIFPKIKCRFSANSPKEYFDLINESIVNGTSTILYQNDDATIPALVRGGRSLEEARDYIVTGCWGVSTWQDNYDHGNYLNLLKPLEFSLHALTENIEIVGIPFEITVGNESFEELYAKMMRNFDMLLTERIRITREGGQILHKVDRLPIFSSTLEDCIKKRKEYSMGGTRYRDDHYLMFGLPNIVDSFLAIKTLVYDQGKCTLGELLNAIRNNWDGMEDLRAAAIACPGWGDGSEESCAMAKRLYDDLYALCESKTGGYGGKVHMGHLTYTEIRWWGEKTRATPDGRKDGEYFAQGLTPSRLKKIPYVTDVINSLTHIDGSKMGANSVVNIILPGGISLDRCEAFLRATAHTAVQSLQLNCVSKEQLLDAQKHPENYPDLIVRVTGFSAKFTSLTKEWQREVLTRNFYN